MITMADIEGQYKIHLIGSMADNKDLYGFISIGGESWGTRFQVVKQGKEYNFFSLSSAIREYNAKEI